MMLDHYVQLGARLHHVHNTTKLANSSVIYNRIHGQKPLGRHIPTAAKLGIGIGNSSKAQCESFTLWQRGHDKYAGISFLRNSRLLFVTCHMSREYRGRWTQAKLKRNMHSVTWPCFSCVEIEFLRMVSKLMKVAKFPRPHFLGKMKRAYRFRTTTVYNSDAHRASAVLGHSLAREEENH